MGADKASLRLGDRTLLERAAAELESIASETWLACGPVERYAELGLPLALDARPDGGPLAGLEAGLARCETEYLAALACDMPRAAASVFLALHRRAEERGLDACFLETEGGVEPLFAVYRRSCLAPVRAALAAGELKMTSFLRFPKADGSLPNSGSFLERELPEPLGRAGIARNLNTPEELLHEVDSGGAR
jgi:molybdopterin-guanine dinucleotide biosynthesis protein A